MIAERENTDKKERTRTSTDGHGPTRTGREDTDREDKRPRVGKEKEQR
jgi:hypothetical protein